MEKVIVVGDVIRRDVPDSDEATTWVDTFTVLNVCGNHMGIKNNTTNHVHKVVKINMDIYPWIIHEPIKPIKKLSNYVFSIEI
jgi:hypothetical protein